MRLSALWLCWCVVAQAQPVCYFSHFTEKDGLSDLHVQCLLRDRQGFLWVGTANGLNRYDGYSFRHYLPDSRRPAHTISHACVYDLKADSSGLIWIATADGLNRYDPATETFRVWKNTGRHDKSLPNSLVRRLLIDRHNRLWLACDNRDLCRYDPATDSFVTYPWKAFLDISTPHAAAEDYKTIHDILPGSADQLWLNTNFGLFGFDISSGQFIAFPAPADALPIAQPADCSDLLYFPAPAPGLLRFDPCRRAWARVRMPGKSGRATRAFFSDNRLWVLGETGLFLQDNPVVPLTAVKATIANRHSAPTGLLESYTVEPDGMIWLGGEQGLWQYDPAAQHFGYTALAPVAAQTNGAAGCFRVIDSPWDHCRYLLDGRAARLQIFEKGRLMKTLPLPEPAAALYESPQGQLWIGCGARVFTLDRQSRQLIPLPLPWRAAPGAITDIDQDAAGKYWFADDNAGLMVWNPNADTWWQPGAKDEFIGKAISDLLADRERRTVWIATQDYGLFRYDEAGGRFMLYRQEETAPGHSLSAYIVHSLCKDGQGYIWAATDPGGLSRFDYDAPPEKAFSALNSENGLPSNQIYAVLADARGNVWAGTSKGLAWVDCRTLRVRSFGGSSGLAADALDQPLSAGAGGEILTGVKGGYQFFEPDQLLAEKHPAKVLLTAFRVFDQPYADSLSATFLKDIRLRWDQDFFSLSFTATNFSRPEKNEYAYRLHGFDPDWVFLKNEHQISYTNVPPGDYLLEIKTGREGRWNTPALQLGIHITPPYWATWWFQSIAALVATGIAIALYRRRIAQIRQQEALKTEFNQRLARMEMAALRAQMNPHFVFNCLSAINRYILVNQPEIASAYLTKFSRLIRLILDNSRTETVPLDKELDALRLYVDMEQMRFNDRFHHQFYIDPAVESAHLEVPPLLIQPFVENAIWHGLMHKKTPGLLQIRVFYKHNKLCVEVEDDGIGRARAQELKSRSATTHKSLGVTVTAERIAAINQLYGTQAEVCTEDLFDENGAPRGTKVHIRF